MQVVCPSCQAINRLPSSREPKMAQCGKCKQKIFQSVALEVSAAVFARHLQKSEIPVVVDFWAPWCGPCKVMGPNFTAAAVELEPDYRLLKLNTENAEQISAQWSIRSIPTMIVFKNGKELARTSGAMDQSQIISWVRQFK